MTNREKFKEVFGFEKNKNICLMPDSVCASVNFECPFCPFKDWWDKEYKSCFKLKEEFDD